jgi:hypothetical protein
MVGPEYAIVVAVRGRQVARRYDRRTGVKAQLDALAAQRALESLLPSPGVRTDVRTREHRSGPHLPRDRDRLGDRVAPTQHERRAVLSERPSEVGEGLEEEGDPVRPRKVALEDAIVEDEQRRHALGGAGRRREGRVVVDTQVAREEDDRVTHFSSSLHPRAAAHSSFPSATRRSCARSRGVRSSPALSVETHSPPGA